VASMENEYRPFSILRFLQQTPVSVPMKDLTYSGPELAKER